MSSTHEARVVRVTEILPHPNAERLGIVHVGGYQTCVRLKDFQAGDLAVFIEPDTLVEVERPEFAFLAEKAKKDKVRIKAMRLRGEQSFGLLIHAPGDMNEDENAWEALGLEHYDPPEVGNNPRFGGGQQEKAPNVPHVKYDMESLRKYANMFDDEEIVQVTEKIHGTNSRFVWDDGELHVSSHSVWKKRDKYCLWWRVATQYALEEKLARYPGYVFYGEVYGQVQDLRYGAGPDQLFWAVFDIMVDGTWLGTNEVEQICAELNVPHVPVLYHGPWSGFNIGLVDGMSVIQGANNIREGVVIKPCIPRNHPEYGRVIGKLVSVDYLSRKERK